MATIENSAIAQPAIGRFGVGAFLAVAFCTGTNVSAETARDVPADNLAYPVLLTYSDGVSGSGFFLDEPAAEYLVTARHVLYDEKNGDYHLHSNEVTATSYDKDPADKSKNVFTLDLATLAQAGNVRHHPTADIAVIKIGIAAGSKGQVTGVSGVHLIAASTHGVLNVSPDALAKFADVVTGNEVVMFGYPTSLGFKTVHQFDLDHPLLRRGIVAGLNFQPTHTIVLDCPTYPGDSGGPIIEIDRQGDGSTRFHVIGVSTEWVPWSKGSVPSLMERILGTFSPDRYTDNSGYSIVTPIDYALELIPSGEPAAPIPR